MNTTGNNENIAERFLFQHLLAMFQTLALQQLGKIMNPINGKLERDLHQAKITIDMITMIQQKTAGNLTAEEKKAIDGVLMDLQMNYVDEMNRGEDEQSSEKSPEDGSPSETVDEQGDKEEETKDTDTTSEP